MSISGTRDFDCIPFLYTECSDYLIQNYHPQGLVTMSAYDSASGYPPEQGILNSKQTAETFGNFWKAQTTSQNLIYIQVNCSFLQVLINRYGLPSASHQLKNIYFCHFSTLLLRRFLIERLSGGVWVRGEGHWYHNYVNNRNYVIQTLLCWFAHWCFHPG